MIKPQTSTRPRGILPPCLRCGSTDPNRMHALMALWFSGPAGVHVDNGYFYLCPRCYETCIAPRVHEILHGVPARTTLTHLASQAR